MNAKKAITVLETQKKKIFKADFTPITWIDETLIYIEQIFGKESVQYNQIFKLKFEKDYPDCSGLRFEIQVNNVKIKNEQDVAADYIESFINQIKKVGIPRKSVIIENMICIEKTLFWTLLPIMIAGCFTLGLYFGNTKFDKEKEDYYSSQKIWKSKYDSLKVEYVSVKKEIDSLKLKK